MDNQEIKNKVKELWEKFWSGGLTNPIDAIQQITYLLFMKQLDENDQKRQGDAEYLGILINQSLKADFICLEKKRKKKNPELQKEHQRRFTLENIFS